MTDNLDVLNPCFYEIIKDNRDSTAQRVGPTDPAKAPRHLTKFVDVAKSRYRDVLASENLARNSWRGIPGG